MTNLGLQGWLEFDSPDLVLGPTSRHLHLHPRPRRPASAAVVHAPAVAAAVAMSTSEYTLPQFTTGTRNNNHGNCTATSTSFWTTYRAFFQLHPTPHAMCSVFYMVPMLIKW